MVVSEGIAVVARAGLNAERLRSLRLAIKRKAPVDTGRLKRSWDDPRTVQMKGDTIEIDNKLPYAKIQDEGGTIPPYDIIAARGPGKVMRAEIPKGSGQIRYFTKRDKIVIKPQNYVAEAIAEWKRTPLGQGQKVGWSPATGGAISKTLVASALALRLRQLTEANNLNRQAELDNV